MENFISPLVLNPVNIIHIAYLAIALLGLMLVGNNTSISSLRILLLLVVLLLIFNLLEETGISPRLLLVTPVFTLGFGPAFYWFCHQLVYSNAPGNKAIGIHLLPMLLALPFTQWPQAVIALGSLSQIIYLSLAFCLIRRYHKVIVQTCSDALDISLHWMSGLLIALVAMMLQDLLRLNLQPIAPTEWLKLWYFINTCSYALLISYLIVMATRQPQLFTQFRQFEFLADDSPVEAPSANNASSLFAEVDKIIRHRELFKQPRFSLRDLATETGIQEKTLSWVINQGAGKNFSEYINQLRIDAACQLFGHAQPGTLLETGFAVGFNSKSSFNAAFKKQTGLTPSQFYKKTKPDADN